MLLHPAFPRGDRLIAALLLAVVPGATGALSQSTPTPASAPPPAAVSAAWPGRIVTIVMRDGLRFDPARFTAAPGEKLRLVIQNTDTSDLVHNFLLLRPGTRDDVVRAALDPALTAGSAADYVPNGPAVLAHSTLLHADHAAEIPVTLPSEPGVYPYVCTFPGHGVMMFGAIYAGVPMPPARHDPHIPKSTVAPIIPGGGSRPFVQRIFMPDAGPASIAVALPGNQNYCWDAGACRLRYAWQGPFVDAGDHWRGNGRALAALSASPWWRAPTVDAGLRLGGESPKFLGYTLSSEGPEFRYRVGTVEVFERITAGAPRGLTIAFRIQGATTPVTYARAPGDPGEWKASAGTWEGDTLTLAPDEARSFSLTVTTPLCTP